MKNLNVLLEEDCSLESKLSTVKFYLQRKYFRRTLNSNGWILLRRSQQSMNTHVVAEESEQRGRRSRTEEAEQHADGGDHSAVPRTDSDKTRRPSRYELCDVGEHSEEAVHPQVQLKHIAEIGRQDGLDDGDTEVIGEPRQADRPEGGRGEDGPPGHFLRRSF
uniref:Uncharacterized protein n=1 Tax=Steinernema glaseri TaxID=37863 RepID=A0A1I7Y242_9BILA